MAQPRQHQTRALHPQPRAITRQVLLKAPTPNGATGTPIRLEAEPADSNMTNTPQIVPFPPKPKMSDLRNPISQPAHRNMPRNSLRDNDLRTTTQPFKARFTPRGRVQKPHLKPILSHFLPTKSVPTRGKPINRAAKRSSIRRVRIGEQAMSNHSPHNPNAAANATMSSRAPMVRARLDWWFFIGG